MRGVTIKSKFQFLIFRFLLTRLMRGVTSDDFSRETDFLVFLLTRLMRGVTRKPDGIRGNGRFLLTRLMRGVTLSGRG